MEVTAGRPHEARRLQLIVCAVALLVIGVTGPAVPIASPQSALVEELVRLMSKPK